MLDPKGSEAERLAGVWWLLLVLATLVAILVVTLIVIALVRGRRAGGPRSSRFSDNRWIVAGGVILPVVVLSVVAVTTVEATADLRVAHPGEVHVEVVGKRWWWQVRYPGEGVVTANEVHVPVGQPVRIGLASDNVVHSFWVPQMAGKLDLIPGQHNDLRFTAKQAGTFRGLCAEYCGLQHARMQFVLVAEPPERFTAWLAAQRRPATATAGRARFETSACAGCHIIRGTQAKGDVGPDLTHVAGRRYLAGNTIANTPAGLRRWVDDPQAVKPGALMPDVPLSSHDLDALVAYLETLR